MAEDPIERGLVGVEEWLLERTYTDLVRFVVRRGYPSERAEEVVAEAFASPTTDHPGDRVGGS